MSRRDMNKKRKRPERTTMRAEISGLESEALKTYLKHHCGGLTIDDALKQALDLWLEKGGHTTLAELTAKYSTWKKTKGGLVQEELF